MPRLNRDQANQFARSAVASLRQELWFLLEDQDNPNSPFHDICEEDVLLLQASVMQDITAEFCRTLVELRFKIRKEREGTNQ